ncbi:MAG: cyclic nucleotide-binding domain-containing protein [Bacteroidetes bacterium]|nr:cyclic nucleotide-binding domain-containing protein [Bacteroidota bacterium]
MKNISISDIKNIPLFNGLTDSHLNDLINIMELRNIDENTIFIKEGDIGSEMFILLNGTVEISRSLILKKSGEGLNRSDKSFLQLDSSTKPFFGEVGLFDENSKRSASVMTKKNSVVAVLKKESFFNLIESNNTIGYKILYNLVKIVSSRLDKTSQDVLKLATALSLALER